MDVITKNQKIAQFFFALGHARRLRIISALSSHPEGLSFEVIEEIALIPGSSLTHHLRILKAAGLVSRKIRGRHSVYSFEKAPLIRFFGTADVTRIAV